MKDARPPVRWLKEMTSRSAHALFAAFASLLGVLFILMAVSGPFTQWMEFETALVYFATQTISGNSHDVGRNVGTMVGYFLVPLMFSAAGAALVTYGRRNWLKAKWETTPHEQGAHVVYLRAFASDQDMARRPLTLGRFFSIRTEEEQMAEALQEIGLVVGIGKPGETLPELGASRIYFSGEEWRRQVLDWFTNAALVVIRLPLKPSAGVLWEISTGLKSVPRDRLVFIVPRKHKGLEWLNDLLQRENVAPLDLSGAVGKVRGSAVSGIVYFNDDGKPCFKEFEKPPLLRRTYGSPLVRAYSVTFDPIIARFNGTRAPLSKEHGEVIANSIWALVLAGSIGLPVSVLLGLTPYDWERAAASGRMLGNRDILPEVRYAKSKEEPVKILGPEKVRSARLQLSDKDLYRYIATVDAMFRAADAAECAALARGNLNETTGLKALLNRIAASDRAIVRSWFESIERVLVEASRPIMLPAHEMSEASLTQAWTSFFRGMPVDAQTRYIAVMENPLTSTPEDLCWHQRETYSRTRQMGEVLGSRFFRAISAES